MAVNDEEMIYPVRDQPLTLRLKTGGGILPKLNVYLDDAMLASGSIEVLTLGPGRDLVGKRLAIQILPEANQQPSASAVIIAGGVREQNFEIRRTGCGIIHIQFVADQSMSARLRRCPEGHYVVEDVSVCPIHGRRLEEVR